MLSLVREDRILVGFRHKRAPQASKGRDRPQIRASRTYVPQERREKMGKGGMSAPNSSETHKSHWPVQMTFSPQSLAGAGRGKGKNGKVSIWLSKILRRDEKKDGGS